MKLTCYLLDLEKNGNLSTVFCVCAWESEVTKWRQIKQNMIIHLKTTSQSFRSQTKTLESCRVTIYTTTTNKRRSYWSLTLITSRACLIFFVTQSPIATLHLTAQIKVRPNLSRTLCDLQITYKNLKHKVSRSLKTCHSVRYSDLKVFSGHRCRLQKNYFSPIFFIFISNEPHLN